MSKRIDRKCRMVEKNRADKSPDKHLHTVSCQLRCPNFQALPKSIEHQTGQDWYNPVEAIEKYQLRKFGQVRHFTVVGRNVAIAGDPAQVRPEKAPLSGRVRIFRLIGKLMVIAMVGSPPERSSLHGGCAEGGKDELGEAGGLESAVGEVSVVEGGDRKHPHPVEDNGRGHCCRACADENDAEADAVHKYQGNPASLL